jgi:hypothetical protein
LRFLRHKSNAFRRNKSAAAARHKERDKDHVTDFPHPVPICKADAAALDTPLWMCCPALAIR